MKITAQPARAIAVSWGDVETAIAESPWLCSSSGAETFY